MQLHGYPNITTGCTIFKNTTHYSNSDCSLTSVPDDIEPYMIHVYLIFNRISGIPDGIFSHLEHCTFLNIQNNILTELTSEMFYGMGSLEALVLSHNSISRIHQGTFQHLSQCKALFLNGNAMTYIRAAIFNGLHSLERLILSENFISDIEPKSFLHLTNLNVLMLNDNKLTTLKQDILPPLHQTKLYIQINSNPLNCDDRLCWIKHAEKDGVITPNITCVNSPGLQWKHVNLNCPIRGKN